ncbi:MAG TPA: hydroxymethylbilane synthase [Solirubrobacteraceae bacterium]|nr:hydroxymethylbilane synthase [Solirubrobacteraceae bacterium]
MRLGTRGSALALAQAQLVADAIGDCEIVVLRTSGDEGAAGDKARWVDTIEQALAEQRIDLAVHSAKDVPATPAAGLALLAALPRAPAEDVLCGAASLAELPPGARVGTASLRRAAQLRAARADLDVRPIGGNVDTRLARLADGEGGLAAIVLARAGLERLGRARDIGAALDPARFVPAPGQGTIALEGRAGDNDAEAAAATAGSSDALAALRAERALAAALRADCTSPLGAHAALDGDRLALRAWAGLPDGSRWVLDELAGDATRPDATGAALAERMNAVGAAEILALAAEAAA